MDQYNESGKVEFEEDKWRDSLPSFHDESPKIVQSLIKYSGGIIKDQRQAEYILIGFVILAIGVSLYLFFGGRSTSTPITPSGLTLAPQSRNS